jgi:hypothetical protein
VDQLVAKQDQIVAKQDQMSGDIAKLLSAKQDIQTRMSGSSRSATPQSRSATPQSRSHAIATPIGPQNLHTDRTARPLNAWSSHLASRHGQPARRSTREF